MRVLRDDTGELEELYLDPAYGFTISKFDLGFPVVREDTLQRVEAHGVRDYTRFYGERVVTIEGMLAPEPSSLRHVMINRLSQYCHPKRRVRLHFTLNDMTETLCVLVRGRSLSRPYSAHNRIPFQAQWICANGIIESSEEFVQPLVLSTDVDLPGWTYPAGGRVYPRTYPEAGSVGTSDVVNSGNETSWPIFRLYGGVTNPIITDVTHNKQYIFNGLTIPDGSWLQVNTADGTVLIDNDINQSQYDKLFIPSGAWWGLPPGTSNFNYTADSSSGTPYADVVYRHAYL